MDERAREAMNDPESVVVTVKGKNGYEMQFRVLGHERTKLEFDVSADAEPIPDALRPDELWAPAWRSQTFSVTQRFSYRDEDFIEGARRVP